MPREPPLHPTPPRSPRRLFSRPTASRRLSSSAPGLFHAHHPPAAALVRHRRRRRRRRLAQRHRTVERGRSATTPGSCAAAGAFEPALRCSSVRPGSAQSHECRLSSKAAARRHAAERRCDDRRPLAALILHSHAHSLCKIERVPTRDRAAPLRSPSCFCYCAL